jgi:long-chain acyl-CoA synthetase
MLTHANFCSNVTDVGSDFALHSHLDVAISFLPLAHVYGRTLDYLYLFNGVPVAYVDVVENVAAALLEIRPTVMAAVPRVFEKIYARLMSREAPLPASRKRSLTGPCTSPNAPHPGVAANHRPDRWSK